MAKYVINLVFLVVTISSCNKSENSPTTPNSSLPVLLDSLIVPSSTDININTYNSSHYVYFKRDATPINKLCVFLPASGAKPENYKLFIQKAAKMGYHSVGLTYPNPTGIYNAGTCETSPDADCFYKLRLETLKGNDESSLISVNFSNSIINRITELILTLKNKYPSHNWGQYIQTSGELNWPKIVFAGHSQGAGHSVFITKFYPIAKAIMMANKDFNTATNLPASWYSLPNVQSTNNVFGFTHGNDEFANQQTVWNSLKLSSLGAVVNIDNTTAPYGSTHRLTTNATPAQLGGTVLGAHSSVATDVYTPKDPNNNAVFDKVWEYLLQ